MIRLSRKRFLVFYFIIIFFWLKSNRTKEIAGIGKSPVPLAMRMCLNVILPVLWRKTFRKILKHEVFSVPCYSVKIFFLTLVFLFENSFSRSLGSYLQFFLLQSNFFCVTRWFYLNIFLYIPPCSAVEKNFSGMKIIYFSNEDIIVEILWLIIIILNLLLCTLVTCGKKLILCLLNYWK